MFSTLCAIKIKFNDFVENMPNPFTFGKLPSALMIFMLYNFGALGVEMLMENDNIQTLMNSGEKFDVCVLEVFNIDALMV